MNFSRLLRYLASYRARPIQLVLVVLLLGITTALVGNVVIERRLELLEILTEFLGE